MSHDIATFWKKSKMGKKNIIEATAIPPYILPDVVDEESNSNYFDAIAYFLINTCGDDFEHGFLDLDDAWQNVDLWKRYEQAQIEGWFKGEKDEKKLLEEMKADAEWLQMMRENLLADYPTPFVQRKAYLFSFQSEDVEEKDKDGNVIGYKKKPRGFKLTKSMYNDDIQFWVYAKICQFKNEIFGAAQKDSKVVSGVNGEETEEINDLIFRYCGLFLNEAAAGKLTNYFVKRVETTTDEKPLKTFQGFVIGAHIKKKPRKDDPINFSYTLNGDDIYLL